MGMRQRGYLSIFTLQDPIEIGPLYISGLSNLTLVKHVRDDPVLGYVKTFRGIKTDVLILQF